MGLRWERKGGGVGGVGWEFARPWQLGQKRSPWATHGTRVTLTPSRDARLPPEAKVDMSTFAQKQMWTCPHFGRQSVLLKNEGAHQKADMSRFENSNVDMSVLRHQNLDMSVFRSQNKDMSLFREGDIDMCALRSAN